jgi:hypothetical protein
MFSHRDDVSPADALGPPVRGWEQVEQTLEQVASQTREGEQRFERIPDYATADMAYVLGIERSKAKLGGSEEIAPSRNSRPISLRLPATIVFWGPVPGRESRVPAAPGPDLASSSVNVSRGTGCRGLGS